MALFKAVNAKVIVLPKRDLNYKLKIVWIFPDTFPLHSTR